jgi:pimeloyl-ACP methyl ester carboxylesterase
MGWIAMSMETRHLRGASGRIAYTRWPGPAGARALVCVHGLTRNGRDFDRLAEILSRDRTVICPDLAGRGQSDWLADSSQYGFQRYLADMTALLAAEGLAEVDWIGTSMGGLIGMMLAGWPGTAVRRLVLNDVGPFMPAAAVRRIAAYVGTDPAFDGLEALEAYLREVFAPFGSLTDEEWRHLAEHSQRRDAGGRLRLNYDPALGRAFKAAFRDDIVLWQFWDKVACPVLVLRGRDSDVLTAETAARMASSGPKAKIVEFAGIGHAPTLTRAEQIACIAEWLAAC